jgi:hypothetical protein
VLGKDSTGRSWALHEKGYITNPATKNKSVWLSAEGAKLSEELFENLFAVKYAHPCCMRQDWAP